MTRRGITQTRMAEDFGVYRQQVQYWISRQDLHLGKCVEFSDYFGMSLNNFLKLGIDYDRESGDGDLK